MVCHSDGIKFPLCVKIVVVVVVVRTVISSKLKHEHSRNNNSQQKRVDDLVGYDFVIFAQTTLY